MKSKLIWGIILLFLLSSITQITLSNEVSYNNIIYVDDDNIDGPWNGTIDNPYKHIQEAVDNAKDNDTIFVNEGLYNENIFIHKTIKLLGENRDNTIVDGGGICEKDCIFILTEANMVIISDFTIQNSGDADSGGDFDSGIDIRSSNNIIINNNISNNGNLGIQLFNSDGNNISYNTFYNNDRAGIEAENSKNNFIFNNVFANNTEWGVMFHLTGESTSNVIMRNNFIDNLRGIAFVKQTGNEILKNNFINNIGGNARSDFDIFSATPIFNNKWNENYWDDKTNLDIKFIPGFLSINIDFNPVNEPYNNQGGV